MLDLLPADVGDVDEPLDALLDLDEGAEIGQAGDRALDPGADAVLLPEGLERVRGGLLEAEGDALGRRVDVEDGDDDLLARAQDLLGVDELAGPGQVGDVDEALDALLELDEGAEVGQAGRPCR